MSSHWLHRIPIVAATLVLLAAVPTTTQAAAIRDDAEFFGEKALKRAEAELAELRKKTGKEVRIETFERPPSTAEDIEKLDKTERAKFFDRLARERATLEKTKGIYILICKHPGHVQVEVDRQTREQGFGSDERNELRDKLLEGFKKKDYDQALREGVDYAVRTLEKLHPRHAALPVGAGGAHPAAPHQRAGGMGWLGWIIVAVLVLVGIRLVASLFALFSGANRPGYGGYGPGPGGFGYGGGGGMLGGLMSGLFGAFAGNWLYHQFFDSSAQAGQPGGFGGESYADDRDRGAGEDFEGSGGDFGDGDDTSGGGDFGGDDLGGGDFGGGDFGGGDFGGGDFGGGDFGGDSGGGDF